MPNAITADGIETKTRAELLAEYTAAFQTIYGLDINLEQDSPDGQILGIFIQSVLDLEDLLVQVFNSFNPDVAIGAILDARVAINGLVRLAGTYTITDITVVKTASVNLYGLDQSTNPVYTVKDNAGNEWYLQTSQIGSAAGTSVFSFRAKNPGAVLTVPNTITIPVTIVLGVASVNNPTAYTTLGTNEESDAALRIRRQKSVALPSQGYRAGLLASLLNTDGVTFAEVYENTGAATDGDGIPGHSIWVIVAGSPADADIAQAIYVQRNAGCGMKGTETFTITQSDGSFFIVRWDYVSTENLYIQFTTTSIDGVTPVDDAALKAYLVANFVPGVNETVNVNSLATFAQAFDPNCLVTLAGFAASGGGPFTNNTLTPSSKDKQFVVLSANITIL